MKFEIHESMRQENNRCQLGYIIIRNAKVQGTPTALAQKFFQLQTLVAKVYNIEGLAKVPSFVGIRNLYNKSDFDRTRYDAKSEALVRRVLGKKDSYYVNSAVVAAQYCSIHFLLPVGVYDLDQINGDVVYGLPKAESYIDINGEKMSTDGQGCLSDDDGVFGNGIIDTRRTAVTLSAQNLLVVVYGNERVEKEELANLLNLIGETMICYNEGAIECQEVI